MAQALSAFLENTVLRYSVTIGLYMCSMGFGALAAEKKFIKHPLVTLAAVEILLTLIGGSAIVILYFMDMLKLSLFIFVVLSHFLIIIIGVLTGLELPLILEIVHVKQKNLENVVLGFDYMGALMGTIIFAFVFYPHIGLLPSAFFVALLNALSGVVLFMLKKEVHGQQQKIFDRLLYCLMVLFFFNLILLKYAGPINIYFINRYIA